MSGMEWALAVVVVAAFWALAVLAAEMFGRWTMRGLKAKPVQRHPDAPGRITVAAWSLRRRWGSKR